WSRHRSKFDSRNGSVPIPPADNLNVKYALAIFAFSLTLGRRVRCFQRLNLVRRQCQRTRDGVLLHMRSGTGFGNRNHVTVADRPGQSDGRRRAAMRYTDAGQSGITQHACAGSAERRIGHDRHAVSLAPWQHVSLNGTVADAVRKLIGRATITLRNAEEILHIANTKVGDTPGTNLSCRA